MKAYIFRIFSLTFLLGFAFNAFAQPEPYPIDRTFVPDLSFLQKHWSAEYNGVDPMSQARITTKRNLCLYDDLTFTNLSYGVIRTRNGISEEMLLRSEKGSYSYDSTTKEISYVLEADTALNMEVYLKNGNVKYIINQYTDTSLNNQYTEQAQFTYLIDGDRQWVIQDSKLGSDQQQGKPAVYVMTGTDLSTSAIFDITVDSHNASTDIYDMKGNKLKYVQSKTIIIKSGKKYLTK